MFARGNGPLVSILLPTRGRPESLVKSLNSCLSKARNKDAVEILLKIDEDDLATSLVAYNEWGNNPLVKCCVSPKGNGYRDLHKFINFLANQARGDWLLVWQDGCEMLTDNWDDLILSHEVLGSPFLGLNDVGLIRLDSAFLVRRRILDILGHVSLSPMCYLWLASIINFMGLLVNNLGIEVRHDKGNDSKESAKAKIEAYKSFHSIAKVQDRYNDLVRVFAHIQEINLVNEYIFNSPIEEAENMDCWFPIAETKATGRFKRGPGPLVSFLLPSRNRPTELAQAVGSIVANAENPSNIEIMVKLDDDDQASIDKISQIKRTYNGTTINCHPSPRGRGYSDLNIWVNDMAEAASGDWLFPFNDDARMTTYGFDTTIENIRIENPYPWSDSVCVLKPSGGNGHAFPILRRDTFKLLGTFSPTYFYDWWIISALDHVGGVCTIPIWVQHHKDHLDYTEKWASENSYWNEIGGRSNLFKRNELTKAQKKLSQFTQYVEHEARKRHALPVM